jgi:putative oxidoreductase
MSFLKLCAELGEEQGARRSERGGAMLYRDLIGSEMQSRVLSVMRIMVALMYLQSGTAKHLKFPHVPSFDNIATFSLPWWGGIVEIICGTLMTLGLFTRPAAFLASGEMAVAYFVAHAPRNFFPQLNGGVAAVVLCFVFLYLAFAGGGAWSLDRLLERRRAPSFR